MSSATESAPIWERQGQEKRTAVKAMFAEIAPVYDRMNAILSFTLHRKWRAFAADQLNLTLGNTALDVCCGTGDFMTELRKLVGPQGQVVGMDFCLPMLEGAQNKQADPLSLGDACALPVKSESVNGVTVGWGIRNVPSIDAAHAEIYRVLKPEGKFVSIDMAIPNHPILRGISKFMFQTVSPALGKLMGKGQAYTYLPASTERFSTRQQLADSMRRAGFIDVQYRDLMLGNICVHWGKKP